MTTKIPERHVVLVAPDVHWNTGNIGRTCLGAGAHLHLIKPFGFSLDSKHVKRAGLDYWHDVNLSVWENFDDFYQAYTPSEKELTFFAKLGQKTFWQMDYPKRSFLVFGSETQGLPESLLKRFPERICSIPISKSIRSLNLSTAAGIALYESLRVYGCENEWIDSD